MAGDDIKNRLEEFGKRKKYASFDEETLVGIEDSLLEQAIMDYIYYKIGDDYRREYEIVTGLSKGFQFVYATWVLEGEVNNGGYHQYFWNTRGQFIVEAIEGFLEIGAARFANLTKRAVALAIEEIPQIRPFMDKGTIEAFRESEKLTKLDDLDYEFYDLYEHEDVSALRIEYIRTHPVIDRPILIHA